MAKAKRDKIRESPTILSTKLCAARRRRKDKDVVVVYDDNRVVVVRAGETVDEFMVRNGVFEKLLSQINNSPQSTDWEAELDELRDRSSHSSSLPWHKP